MRVWQLKYVIPVLAIESIWPLKQVIPGLAIESVAAETSFTCAGD